MKLELEGLGEPEVRSEKVVLRLMREMGLLAAPPRAAGYSSYSAAADDSDLPYAPLNADGTHDFSASAPNELWLTDVTQMRIPAGRAYLSPVLDCFDGALAGWAVSTSATAEALTDPSLRAACATLREGDAPTLHSDRGAQYHASIKIDPHLSITRTSRGNATPKVGEKAARAMRETLHRATFSYRSNALRSFPYLTCWKSHSITAMQLYA